ncbi:MAG TPA: mycofactocin-coupled SDR family oxidoreductase [Pseudonocardiaceae bacterium]|jgi:SDR family mycofactocin-dependent oxidoreductase|nr:mycofactocin-coupled SDR family oxidoreductase [Pseudonocardiaceae bacterium]
MGLLDGKVALITGGARGQGRAHAITSAREGAEVILVDIADQIDSVDYPMARADDLAETVRQVEALDRRALAITADVRSQEQLDAAVASGIAEFGRIDILIANAGIWTQAPFWELSEESWTDMIDVNLTGVWKSAKAVAPHMIERGSGSIVITSSVNGLEPGVNYAHYVSAKHGVIGLMKNIALELAPYGIRCNSINPGAIRTPMTDHQGAWDMFAGHPNGTEADMLAGGYHFHALKGRTFLPPQVIADTALYLNSDLAAAVTGVTIPVDAGHMILPGMNTAPVK